MHTRNFPAFPTHEAASADGCFSCCNPLDGATMRDTGNPDGHGRYRQTCRSTTLAWTGCGKHTYYDLAPSHKGFASAEAKAAWLNGANNCSDTGISGFQKWTK